MVLPLEECSSSHRPVIEFPDKSTDFTVIVAGEPVLFEVGAGLLGSNKKFIDTPLMEVIMVPLPKTLTPSTSVEAPVDVVLLGSGTPRFSLDTDPLVVVTLVETVVSVVVLARVVELLKEVSNGEVTLSIVNAFTGTMSAIGNNMMVKTTIPNMERDLFPENFIYLMYNRITYLNIPSLLCKIDIIDESSIFLYLFLNNWDKSGVN
jgi:hypothetical protein